MATVKRARTMSIVSTRPDGRQSRFSVPAHLAWTCARAIAQHTHCTATLYGQYGHAEFCADGSGDVTWNSDSTCPGKVSRFFSETTVCI